MNMFLFSMNFSCERWHLNFFLCLDGRSILIHQRMGYNIRIVKWKIVSLKSELIQMSHSKFWFGRMNGNYWNSKHLTNIAYRIGAKRNNAISGYHIRIIGSYHSCTLWFVPSILPRSKLGCLILREIILSY